ncbi:hypothetical protein H1V43_32415 [Streptomyces sp. PSKA54]|uniref:Uncharacterized protein n=1 Tax=Streptomyces himalayensis subsp. aureolus TaxID=2758039 RepID=A0A7W2D723_9ACTN|nr:hypothetical protein [Streptomyces himalayensis]MBA4865968.1 hypothetical protein [Streptomyces himalayensis subsp. aureolus]
MRRRTREQAARYQQVIEQRDDAVELAAERLRTITRQAGEIDALREQLKAKPAEAALKAELQRRTKAYAALEEQLLTLQHVNEVQARELRAHAEEKREATA